MRNVNLIEQAVRQNMGFLSKEGALVVQTGTCTGRSTKERYIVKEPSTEGSIAWGAVNQPLDPSIAEEFFKALKTRSSDGYSMTGYAGCFRVKVSSTSSWHVAFAKNMFRESFIEALGQQVLDQKDICIEIFHVPEGHLKDLNLPLNHDRAIVLDLKNLRVGIIGTAYAGEIKKSAFTICNYLFPKYDLFPMHAAGNCRPDGSQACVLFGLSGTGKTTLSTDSERFPHRG